jgi:hypothetical protein
MKDLNIVDRNKGRNRDDWLMKYRHIIKRNTGSMWDDSLMKHNHIVARSTGNIWNTFSTELLVVRAVFGMIGTRNIAKKSLKIPEVYGMACS